MGCLVYMIVLIFLFLVVYFLGTIVAFTLTESSAIAMIGGILAVILAIYYVVHHSSK